MEYGYTAAADGTDLGPATVAEVAGAHDRSLAVAAADAGGARFEVHAG